MNVEQFKSLCRSIILFVAGIVGGVGVAKGWYSSEQLAAFLNGPLFGAVLTFIATAAYGLWMNTKISLLTASANVAPETTTIAPKALASVVAAPNVVAEGSAAAKEAAKP